MGYVAQPVKLLNATGEFVSGKGTLYRQRWAAPTAGSTTNVLAAHALSASVQQVPLVGGPAHPRNLVVTGNASGIAGNVVITGFDQFGVAKTETIALSGTASVAGAVAWSLITNAQLPVQTHVGTDTVAIGYGVVFGLERHLAEDSILYSTLDTAKGITYVLHLAQNSISFSTAPNGTRNFVCAFVHVDLNNA